MAKKAFPQRSSDHSGDHSIEDIARASRVSVSTVSRILNNRPDVSEATRKRVLAVIQRMGYFPHPHAQRLASGTSDTIAMLHPITGDADYHAAGFHTRGKRRGRGAALLLQLRHPTLDPGRPEIDLPQPPRGRGDPDGDLPLGLARRFPAPGRAAIRHDREDIGVRRPVLRRPGLPRRRHHSDGPSHRPRASQDRLPAASAGAAWRKATGPPCGSRMHTRAT